MNFPNSRLLPAAHAVWMLVSQNVWAFQPMLQHQGGVMSNSPVAPSATITP